MAVTFLLVQFLFFTHFIAKFSAINKHRHCMTLSRLMSTIRSQKPAQIYPCLSEYKSSTAPSIFGTRLHQGSFFSRYNTTLNTRNGYQPKVSSKGPGALHSYRLHSEAWQAVFLPNLLLVFGFIINFDSLTLIYLGMRQVRQSQFFRIFQRKVPSIRVCGTAACDKRN